MHISKLKVAEAEAKRFLERVKAYRSSEVQYEPGFLSYGVKESGALRRASLDLTRALADLRKPS